MAKALDYADPSRALRQHIDKEDKILLSKRYCEEFLRGQNALLENFPNRGLTIINESCVYSLIMSSKLPDAKKFKHWVTSEVLPEIRRTGGYGNRSLIDEKLYSELKALRQKIDTLEKKVDAIDKKSKDIVDAIIVPGFNGLHNKIESTSEKSDRNIIRSVTENVKLLGTYIDTLIKKIK